MGASLHGIVWPAVASPTPAAALAIVEELERTQWWEPAELARQQQQQLASLLAHAVASVPFYRGLVPGRVPITTRAQLAGAGDALLSRAYPATHGAAPEVFTSRTSGQPVRVRGTGVIGALQAAITLRDHRWHRRDLRASLAAIRYAPTAVPPDGAVARGWGAATAQLAPDAPSAVLSVTGTSTDEQLAWLVRRDPAYLLVYPSVLDALLRRIAQTGVRLPGLREVRTVGERLPPTTRTRCREVLGVPLVDTYSAQEVGYIALQCPEHAHYHVQSERLLVEILQDDETPCDPGEVGRVVLTDLHNFATPIIRYDIGDLAEVGGPCPCGRTLPVLARIIGRTRELVRFPDGRTMYPTFTIACREAARYRELQLVQVSRTTLRARVVPDPDAVLDREALIAALHRAFGYPFAVEIELVDEIARTPAGKLQEFRAELPDEA